MSACGRVISHGNNLLLQLGEKQGATQAPFAVISPISQSRHTPGCHAKKPGFMIANQETDLPTGSDYWVDLRSVRLITLPRSQIGDICKLKDAIMGHIQECAMKGGKIDSEIMEYFDLIRY